MLVRLKSVGLAIAVVSVLFAGCTSKPMKPMAQVPDCVFPDATEVAAPGWVCDEPVEGVAVSAVGSFRQTKAGPQFAKTQAVAAGRNALAAQMKVHVKQLVKNYVSTTGVGDDETVDTVSSDVSKQITSETLQGSRVYKTRVSPNGVTYALVGMDPTNAAANTQAALRTSMGNKKALWQRFLAKKADAELDAEIDKISNQMNDQ